LKGITPYAGRPSFYNNDNLNDAVNKTCYFWDNGLALPPVPSNLVIGQPAGAEHIEAFEFVLFTESADSLAFEMARRPHDPHDISVDEAQAVLDIWLDKFNTDVPMTLKEDTSTYAGADGKGIMINTFGTSSLNIIVDNASAGRFSMSRCSCWS